MQEKDLLAKRSFIFGCMFLLPNKLQVITDRALAEHGLTTKQWLLTAMLEQFGDNFPTLNEVSEAMSSSHQNVKQIALKLEKKGFLRIEKDERDSRAIRLKLTEKSYAFWKKRQAEQERFIDELFADFSEDEIELLYSCLNKLSEVILKNVKALNK